MSNNEEIIEKKKLIEEISTGPEESINQQENNLNDQNNSNMQNEEISKTNNENIQTENTSNASDNISVSANANDNNTNIFKQNILRCLNTIREMSNSNTPESFQYFNESIPVILNNFLASNMLVYNIEMLKLILLFLTNYIQIRIEYLDSMPNYEICALLRILDSAFPFYLNINNFINNNNNNLSSFNSNSNSNEAYQDFFRNIYPEISITSVNIRFSNNANVFYRFVLNFILRIPFFQNFINLLNSPFLEFEKFYFIYTNLVKIIILYDNVDENSISIEKNIPIDLTKAICNYYSQLFENGGVKELNKHFHETIFKANFYNEVNLLYILGDEKILKIENDVENDKLDFPYHELIKIDLNLIYFLILSSNLERRVTGMKALNDLIQFLLANDKFDEEVLLTNRYMRFVHQFIQIKKKVLITWLEKIGIFQIIFGENIHEAILKKSSLILIYLYINYKLSFDQIDYIWKIAQDKHEAISASILNIFSDLISYLSIEHAMHILKIINEIPFKEVNDVTIKILDSFSNNKYLTLSNMENKDTKINNLNNKEGDTLLNVNLKENINSNLNNNPQTTSNINNNLEINLINNISGEANLDFLFNSALINDTKNLNNFKSFFLKILWKFSSENSFYSGLAPQIISRARKVMAEILIKPVFKYELAKYVKKCIMGMNYVNGNGMLGMLTTNLTILDLILKNMKSANSNSINYINMFSSFSNEIKDFKSFIDYLEKQYSLTSTILHGVINVKKEVMVIAGEIINIEIGMRSQTQIGINGEINYTNYLVNEDKANLNNFTDLNSNDLMIDHEINKDEKIYNQKFIQEESKDLEKNIGMGLGATTISNLDKNILLNEDEFTDRLNQNRENENENHNNNNNNNNQNLDETLSTEKSLDNSISTISTDTSSIEKSRIYMVKEFIENNLNLTNFTNLCPAINTPLLQDNYEIIFKKLKLNNSNSNYYSIVTTLLEFFKYIIFNSNILITATQIEYLFTLLVDNSIDVEEMNLFYFFFAEIFRYQQMTRQIYISEENFNFILFDVLLKIELNCLPYAAFNLFKQIFFYINSTHNNILIISQKIVDVKDFAGLIGFETLWKFYIESEDVNISNDAQALLVGIISALAKKEEQSFAIIFEKIFSNLNVFYNQLSLSKNKTENSILNNNNNNNNIENITNSVNEKENGEFEGRTNKLIKLLFIVNSTSQKIEKQFNSEILNINIQNFYNGGDAKKTTISVPSDMHIKDLKLAIISKVININMSNTMSNDYTPIIEDGSLMLLSKGRILKNDKLTLKDLKIINNALIIVHKCQDDNLMMEVDISEEKVNELVMNVQFLFEGCESEIIKRALKRNNYNADDTVVYLFDEANMANLKLELQEELSLPIITTQDQHHNNELFDEIKLKLLIGLLDLEIISLNKNIWELLSAIKFPNSLISILLEPELINFHNIFDISKPNQMLLYLRILNCLIFNDRFFSTSLGQGHFDENKVAEWKINFLISDGIGVLLDSSSRIINLLGGNLNINTNLNIKSNSSYCYLNSYVNVLGIISMWLHFFTFSTALSLSPNKESLYSTLKGVFLKRPQGVQIGVPTNNNSNGNGNGNTPPKTPDSLTPKNSSIATPTFGTPNSHSHSSFSDKNEKNEKKGKCFFLIGAESFDSNYEEEVSNSFYIKLITANYHIDIIKYIKFASQPEISNYFSQENEKTYLQLLEILIILNEMNPQSFKDTIQIEYQESIIINLLFIEKSKFVRIAVENLFNKLLTQSKNSDLLSFNKLQLPSIQLEKIKSIKDIITIHIFNNYKRIYSGQVYEEFFNLFGSLLTSNNDEILLDSNLNISSLTSHILNLIYTLSQKNDTELSDIEREQLSGNMYLFQCLCTNNEVVVLDCLDMSEKTEGLFIVKFMYANLFSNGNNNKNNNLAFKYSSRNLRAKAFNLLSSLMRLKEGYKKELGACLLTHHTSFKNDVINKMDFDIGLRTSKFIGLKNYGCTCYLNSLIQQLFMIPSFKSAIYLVNILDRQDLFPDLSLNPFYQLQLLFANLSHSIKQFHTPLHFIKSFNAFNNEPINVSVQQDCEEFLNILIDRLEDNSKKLNQENVLEKSIRCKLSYETISIEKDSPYYSESESSCLAINLDIKNKRSIEEGLDLFVKGEILEGENKYHCEDYNKKISIIRRCSIKKLPENVIINLKRFEFDYNTFEKVKLNDYCEFPMVIDFKPWMRLSILTQNLDNDNKNVVVDEEEMSKMNDPEAFKYKLTGILVHSGATAEGGHYFSYIFDEKTGKWHRYDDSKISEFDPKDIKAECFGDNKEGVGVGEGSTNLYNNVYSKSQNAYLLFYSKINVNAGVNIECTPPENILTQIKDENTQFMKYKNFLDNDYYMFLRDFFEYNVAGNSTSNNNKHIERLAKEKSMSRQDKINEEVFNLYNANYEIIQKSNLQLGNDNNVINNESCKKNYLEAQENIISSYNQNKIKMINSKQIMSSGTGSDSGPTISKKKIIKLAVYYYFEIITQQQDKHKTNTNANFIRDLLETDRNLCAWFLKTFINNKQLFMEYIIGSNHSEIREGFSRIIISCILSLYNDESKYLTETFKFYSYSSSSSDNNNESLITNEEYRSVVMRFFKNNMLDMFDLIRPYWTKYNQFLQIIFECINSFRIVDLAFKCDLFTRIIYFIMNNQKRYETKYFTIGNKALEPNFKIMIDILTNMILSCVTKGVLKLNKYSPYSIFQSQDEGHIQTPANLDLLLNKEVLTNNILRRYQSESTGKLLHHLGWGDLETSVKIINDVLITVKEDIYGIINLIKNAGVLFEIEDNYRNKRIEAFFCLDDISETENDSIFNFLMSFRDETPLSVLICLQLLGDIIKKDKVVMGYVSNFAAKLVWIFYFLKDINNDEIKRDNLQIEATTVDNVNVIEVLKYVDELYINELKIKFIVNSGNNIGSGIEFNFVNSGGESYKESDMLLDFNQEIQDINSLNNINSTNINYLDENNARNEKPPTGPM